MTSKIVICFLISLRVIAVDAGYASYNSATHLCCNGTVVAKAPQVECCGTLSFDRRDFVCCDGRSLHPLPVGRNDSTYDCCYDDDGDAALYDFTTHQCCDGLVVLKPKTDALYACCRKVLFSVTVQQCCDGRVVPRGPDESCCGAEVYNKRNQTCCKQWGALDGKLVRISVEVFDHRGGATKCCGIAGLYDPSVSICCMEKLQPLPTNADSADCCQDVPYDLELETCCAKYSKHDGRWVLEGYRIEKVPNGLCCGLVVFDFQKHVCCGETLHTRPKGDHATVCCGEHLLGDPASEACLNGMVVARNGTAEHSCNGRLYFLDTHECCNGKVVAIESDVEECCWDAKQAYRKDKEMCCGAEVVPIDDLHQTSGSDSCCAPEIPS